MTKNIKVDIEGFSLELDKADHVRDLVLRAVGDKTQYVLKVVSREGEVIEIIFKDYVGGARARERVRAYIIAYKAIISGGIHYDHGGIAARFIKTEDILSVSGISNKKFVIATTTGDICIGSNYQSRLETAHLVFSFIAKHSGENAI